MFPLAIMQTPSDINNIFKLSVIIVIVVVFISGYN